LSSNEDYTAGRPVGHIWELVSHLFMYGVGNFLIRVLGVISTAVLARLLTVSQFGQLDFLVTLYVMVAATSSMQTETALLRLYHSVSGRERGRLLFTHLGWVTFLGLGLGTATFFLAGPILRLAVPAEARTLQPEWIAPVIFSWYWSTHVSILLRTSRRVRAAVAFPCLVTLGQVCLAIPLALAWGVGGVLLARFLAETIGSVVVLWWRRGDYRLGFSFHWLARMVRFGWPLLPDVVARGGLANLMRYLVIAFWGASQLGLLSVALRVSMITSIFVGALKMAWLPFALSHERDSGSEGDQAEIYKSYLRVMTFISLGCFLFSIDIIRVLVGAKFEAAAGLTGLLFASVFLQGASNFVITPLYTRNRTMPIMLASLISASLAAGMALWIIPRWGLYAAAVTQVIVPLVSNLLLSVWMRVRLGVRQPVWWPMAFTALIGILTFTVMDWVIASSLWTRIALGLGLLGLSLIFLRREISKTWAKTRRRLAGVEARR
jgi:O-antigen/teichoic acid export membrane protein